MAQPYIGEIRIFAGSFAPMGWMFCEGQLLPISEYDTLFAVIGTTYGGDGQETFALPDLRGRLPVHQGKGSSGTTYTIGEAAGVEEVTLTIQQMPAHSHPLLVSTASATQNAPAGSMPGNSPSMDLYRESNPNQGTNFNAQALTPRGGSQPHTNFQPYLCMSYILSLYGIFPTQS
ncbi:MAG TPA: tail fiber protein [Allosphingosinicella sp.]|jgi:microcystin-dependent protein